MTLRVGINGFGRIGRSVTRILRQTPGMKLVAINDLAEPEQLAYLLKYDTIFGNFHGSVQTQGQCLHIDDWKVHVSSERDPENIAWGVHKVDVVLESTGAFKQRDQLEKHLKAGAPKVLLSVPPKGSLDATIVFGVNEDTLKPSDTLVSNASCTTNAAAPLLKLLHQAFGIQSGYLNTIHAYTNAQKIHDSPNKDWRRGRAALSSIIPTTTGAAQAVAEVIPELAGKLQGMAYRVPVINGSMVDLVLNFEREVSVESLNNLIEKASKTTHNGIIAFTTDALVSSDIIGNSHSSIFDASLTQLITPFSAHIASWYDNEFGYSHRLVDLLRKMT